MYVSVQDYDEMVSLIEDMDAVPSLRVTNTVGIQNLYAFALNRRNASGDRDKALIVIHKVSTTLNCSFYRAICDPFLECSIPECLEDN